MKTRVFRWKGVVPLLLTLVLVAVLWMLFADVAVERAVEQGGTAVVGAKVDVAEADIRLTEGVVMLRGLQVTNPRSPMTNLFEADQIVLNLRVAPLLEKKVILDTVAMRGLRFGTARATSGAVDDPSATSTEVARAVDEWQARLPIPELGLGAVGQVVNVDAVSQDSLATLRQARALATLAESAKGTWTARVDQLDPRPTIDSAAALAKRLEGQSIRTLGLAGARDAATSARRTVTTLTQLDDQLKVLQAGVDSAVRQARAGITALSDARAADYAYARRLLKLPSLDAPELGPALFGRFAAEQLGPVLYWLGLAERYMPPGLKSRFHQGPDRVRQAGTTVAFPKERNLPGFLMQVAELSLELGGTGAAAGEYAGRITNLTSAPALVGRPTTFAAGRTGGAVGPETVRIGGALDRLGAIAKDSVSALVGGMRLPTVALAPLGADLELGSGTTELALVRVGDSLRARVAWRSSDVTWRRLTPTAATAGAPGVAAALGRSAMDVAWRTVSALSDVRIEAQLSGSLANPRLAVGSNVVGAVGDALRQELGAEARRLEADVRGRVDALVDERVAAAEGAVRGFETQALEGIGAERARLEQVKRDLEARVRALAGVPGLGGR